MNTPQPTSGAGDDRIARMLNNFAAAHKRDGTKPTDWEMISLLSGAVIDLEEQVADLRRQLHELTACAPPADSS